LPAGYLKETPSVELSMPTVDLEAETIERLDDLRIDDESYDEVINELINIYQAEELTLFRGSDEDY